MIGRALLAAMQSTEGDSFPLGRGSSLFCFVYFLPFTEMLVFFCCCCCYLAMISTITEKIMMTVHENRKKGFCFLFTPAPSPSLPTLPNKVSNQRLHWSPRNSLVQESENGALDWGSYHGLGSEVYFLNLTSKKMGSFLP